MRQLSNVGGRVPASAPHPTPRSRLAQRLKGSARRGLPVGLRKRIAVWLGRQRWISSREWWSQELLRDLAEDQPNAYHSFLWKHHLAYASTYEVGERFGGERIHPSRILLFEQLLENLRREGIQPDRDVRSVLEVGSSMGYLLRHLEVEEFRSAQVLDGVDIDAYAVREGGRHLKREGSRVRLLHGDMRDLDALLGSATYDVAICAGVLMYLERDEAAHVVREVLRRTRGLVALAGLAHPDTDNRALERSERRVRDQTFVHNLDTMAQDAGGTVVDRRWEGDRQINGNTVYFVFCRPGR